MGGRGQSDPLRPQILQPTPLSSPSPDGNAVERECVTIYKRPMGHITHLKRFWRRRFFKLPDFSLFCYYLPLKGIGFSFYKLYYLFNTRMLVQSLVDIGSVLLEKQMKMWKCQARIQKFFPRGVQP